MCGIAGIWTRGGAVASADLVAMQEAMRLRGPDDAGTWLDRDVGLAHRRLSIVDLSAAARQPLASEDGRVKVVFNGEIYDHLALRAALEARGHRFRTTTDGEVLVHGWEEWGAGVVERLNGMFAFAVWDGRARRLLLARDRLGEKPLYLLRAGRTVAFASEVKALALAFPGAVTIDWRAIDAYLHFGFVPQELGVFHEIEAVPPAHLLEIDEHAERRERYWSVAFRARTNDASDATAVRDTLGAAVTRRLMADVPVGTLLSGGVDSSVVAALARREAPGLEAFTVGFAGDGAADLEADAQAARAVARTLDIRHHEARLGNEAVQALDTLVWAFGVPFGDPSAIPTYFAGRLAGERVKVVLTGDGGDEVFGGYANAQAAYLGAVCRRLARRVPGGMALLSRAAGLDGRVPRRPRWLHRLATVLRHAGGGLGAGLRWTNGWHGDGLRAVRGPALRDAAATDPETMLLRHAIAAGATDDVERLLWADTALVLPGDYLVKVDVALMASSVEGRAPFLDVEMLELGARLPLATKLSPLRSKHLLKQVALDLGLPREAMLRPKQGFAAPIDAWLRGPLRARARDCILGTLPGRGVVDGPTVRRAWDAHLRGEPGHGPGLWILLCLELWFRTFIDRELPLAAEGGCA